jgi:hypothetical protein
MGRYEPVPAGAYAPRPGVSSNGGACVDVADNLPGIVAVRDSKDPHGPNLTFSRDAWLEFTSSVKRGELDFG